MRQGGRKAAKERRHKLPTYAVFSYGRAPQELMARDVADQLFAMADQLLSDVGIDVGEWGRRLATKGVPTGCHLKGEKLYFERGAAREILTSAPSDFIVNARDPKKSVRVGGRNGVFAAGHGALMVRGAGQERRVPMINDASNFVRLSQFAPALQVTSGLCGPISDSATGLVHLELAKLYLTLSDQAFLSPARSAGQVRDLIQIADLAFGGRSDRHPFMLGTVHWNRPLSFDAEMLDLLAAYADHAQAVILSPIMTLGATAPASVSDALVQWLAETMAAASVSQMLKPGLPIVVGGMFTSLAMKYGTPKFTGPEISHMTHAASQLARMLHIPFWSGAGLTSTKTLDGQAGSECQLHLDDIGLSQAHMASGSFGTLEAGQVADVGKFVLDAQLIENKQAILRSGRLQASSDVGAMFDDMHGRSFMGHPHTQHMTDALSAKNPAYNDDLYELWQAGGAEEMHDRTRRIAQSWLAEYEKPDIDPAIERDMCAFLDKQLACAPTRSPACVHPSKPEKHVNIQSDIAGLLHDNIWDGVFKRR